MALIAKRVWDNSFAQKEREKRRRKVLMDQMRALRSQEVGRVTDVATAGESVSPQCMYVCTYVHTIVCTYVGGWAERDQRCFMSRRLCVPVVYVVL